MKIAGRESVAVASPTAVRAGWEAHPTGEQVHPTGPATREIEIQVGKVRSTIRWRYAFYDDLNETLRRNKVRERVNDAIRRGQMIQIWSGPPLEVKKGVFVVNEPNLVHEAEQKKFKAEWLRREAEAMAAGLPW